MRHFLFFKRLEFSILYIWKNSKPPHAKTYAKKNYYESSKLYVAFIFMKVKYNESIIVWIFKEVSPYLTHIQSISKTVSMDFDEN